MQNENIIRQLVGWAIKRGRASLPQLERQALELGASLSARKSIAEAAMRRLLNTN